MKRTINIKGKIISLDQPLVMGILNLTPDSFYDGGTNSTLENIFSKQNNLSSLKLNLNSLFAFAYFEVCLLNAS